MELDLVAVLEADEAEVARVREVGSGPYESAPKRRQSPAASRIRSRTSTRSSRSWAFVPVNP